MTSEVIAPRRVWAQVLCTDEELVPHTSTEQGFIMTSIVANSFLKGALIADAGVSGAVALLQLLASGQLAALTGLSAALLVGTGVFLVGYVALLIALATRAQVWSALIWAVIVGNLAWAVAALAVSASLPLAPLGHAFAIVHAVAVAAFAYLEYRGLGASISGARDALRA
jgi:hypothetical protein